MFVGPILFIILMKFNLTSPPKREPTKPTVVSRIDAIKALRTATKITLSDALHYITINFEYSDEIELNKLALLIRELNEHLRTG